MPTIISGNKIKIHLEKNALPGYSLQLTKKERRLILNKLVKQFGWVNIVRKLNVLYIYNKNKHPTTADKFRRDMKYIQKSFSPTSKSKKSPKMRRSRKLTKSRRSRKLTKLRRSRKLRKSRRSKNLQRSRKLRKSRNSRKLRKSPKLPKIKK